MAKVLVTGGAGFIGSHIVGSLVKLGHQVRILDNFSTGTLENLSGVDAEVYDGDILDPGILASAMQGVDLVSHQAAQLEIASSERSPVRDIETNIIGTVNVLKAAVKAGVKRMVAASSACIYGECRRSGASEVDDPRPNWAYGVSKLATEHYLRQARDAGAIETVSLRYAIVYGPREWYGRVLTMFLARLFDGLPPVIFGAGKQIRDFIHVSDVVTIHNRCLLDEAPRHHTYNVGTNRATTISDLAELCCDVAGVGIRPMREETKPGEFSRAMPDRIRLPSELKVLRLGNYRALLDFKEPPMRLLADGLETEWEWLAGHRERWVKPNV